MAKKTTPTQNYIVPFLSDYGFKVVFTDEHNTLFARKVIEKILKDERPIEKLTLRRNEFAALTDSARSGIFDTLCEDELRRVFIIGSLKILVVE